MAKAKNKNKQSGAPVANKPNIAALEDLRSDQNLWYKILVLLYDFRNITKDKACEIRLSQTTDPQFISVPYFTPEEAVAVKGAVLETGKTVEEAITEKFANFAEKRSASGDFRPCGPHDMGPAYMEVFGVSKSEIEDEKFVSRVKRSGLKCG